LRRDLGSDRLGVGVFGVEDRGNKRGDRVQKE